MHPPPPWDVADTDVLPAKRGRTSEHPEPLHPHTFDHRLITDSDPEAISLEDIDRCLLCKDISTLLARITVMTTREAGFNVNRMPIPDELTKRLCLKAQEIIRTKPTKRHSSS